MILTDSQRHYFTDPQLQKCFEANLAGTRDFSAELCQVRALVAVHDFFRGLEGPDSARVHETIWHLLLPRLRPGLRHYYQLTQAEQDSAEFVLRQQLSELAEERLECNPGYAAPPEPAPE